MRVPRALSWIVISTVLLAGCAGAGGGSATGLTGGTVTCAEGSRPALDCRGVLQQFARNFKADVSVVGEVNAGAAIAAAKLIEADALTADIIQHHYQTCSLYNACVISPQQFSARMDRLQQLQIEVRRAAAAGGVTAVAGQQNIHIGSGASAQAPQPPAAPPPPPAPPAPPTRSGTPAADASDPGVDGKVDAVLNILRAGALALRSSGADTRQDALAPGGDLDEALRAMLFALKEDIARRHPGLAQARAVVGNFTEEGRPFGGPLGAVLQERAAALVRTERLFEPPARQERTLTVGDIAQVPNPNAVPAQAAIYGADLTISGRYRLEGDRVAVGLSALDPRGQTLASASRAVAAPAAPSVLPATAPNAAATEQLLAMLAGLGPRRQGDARVEITTNRPGEGASFRLEEEIRYLVVSTTAGYLYLFHVDAEGRVVRIFPNDYQRDARIEATSLEVPAPGGPIRFEASPPFGLETTVALVATSPLERQALREIATALSQAATPRAPAASVGSAPLAGVLWGSVTTLIRP